MTRTLRRRIIGWLIAGLRGHKGSFSFAPPFLCGIAGTIACFTCPSPGVWRWAWLPPLIDPSSGLILFLSVLHVVARMTGLRSPFDGETSQPPEDQKQP